MKFSLKFPFKFKFGKGKRDDDDEVDDFDDEDDDGLVDSDVDSAADSGDDDGDAKETSNDDAEAIAAPVGSGEDEDAADDGGDSTDDDSADDDLDDDDDDDFDGDDFGDDDFDEKSTKSGGRTRLIAIVAVGAVVVLALVGGGAWWLFAAIGGDETSGTNAKPETESAIQSSAAPGVPRVEMALPPKSDATGRGALTPPTQGGPAGKMPPASSGAVPRGAVPRGAVASPGGAVPGSLNAIAAASLSGYAAVSVVAAAVSPEAFSQIPQFEIARAPGTFPDPSLVEETANGLLPKIGEDGKTVLQAYAGQFDHDDSRLRVAVILTGLGLNSAATAAAIARLPGGITLAFDPYGKDLEDWMVKAHDHGHEFLLSLPLEPENPAFHDPGPLALGTKLTPEENLKRLEFILGRVGGYVGVLVQGGGRFLADQEQLTAVLQVLKKRGLMLVGDATARDTLLPKLATKLGVPMAKIDVVLDTVPAKSAIQSALNGLEEKGRRSKRAMGVGALYPSTLERVASWAKGLDGKNIALAPVSAFVDGKSGK